MHRDFDADAFMIVDGVKKVRMQYGLRPVDVFDETLDATGESEHLFLARTLILQFDTNSVIQKRQFAQALGQNFVMKLDVAENLRTGVKMDFRAAPLGCAGYRQRSNRVAVAKLHRMHLPIAPYRQLQQI